MEFQTGDRVYIVPTGDPMIDWFLGQQMTILDIIPVRDGDARYTSYLLVNAAGDKIRVIDGELEYPDA